MSIFLSVLFTYILIGCLVAAIRKKFRVGDYYSSLEEDKYAIVAIWPFYLIGNIFKFIIDFLVDVFFGWVIKKANAQSVPRRQDRDPNFDKTLIKNCVEKLKTE